MSRYTHLLGSERHCGLPFFFGGLPGASALLHRQAAVGLPFERADKFGRSERPPCVRIVTYRGQLGFGFLRSDKGSPLVYRPSSLPGLHREVGVEGQFALMDF
jgi:hypothetical protein